MMEGIIFWGGCCQHWEGQESSAKILGRISIVSMHHYRYRTYYRSVNSSWRRRRRSSPKQKIFFGLLVFAIFSFVKVWQKTNVDYQHRRNDQLQAELQQLRGENALMEAQIEELRAAGRLTAIATEKLHLTFVPKINLQEKTAFEKLTARLDRLQK